MRRFYKPRSATIAAYRRSSRFARGQTYNMVRKHEDTFQISYDGLAQFSSDSWYFTLSQLPNYTEFTDLFDQYRIVGIRALFMPRLNMQSNSQQVAAFTEIPPIHTAVDTDDASNFASYSEALQHANLKTHNQFRPFSVFFRPKISTAAYSGAFTSYTANTSPWIDCSSPGVQYYGLKICTSNYSAANNQSIDPTWDIVFTYYLQFKNLR